MCCNGDNAEKCFMEVCLKALKQSRHLHLSPLAVPQIKAEAALKLFPYELKSVEEIKAKVEQSKINFYDITFSP